MTEKYCPRCERVRAVEHFSPNAAQKSGLQTWCTDCWRNYHYVKKYGITLDDYDRMLAEQGGKCAICGKEASAFKRRFHVDHAHDSGKVRGLLCVNCNTAIGKLEESPELFSRALEYLRVYAS